MGLHSVLIHAKQQALHKAVAAPTPGCIATATVEPARQLLVAQTLYKEDAFTHDTRLDRTLYVCVGHDWAYKHVAHTTLASKRFMRQV